MSVICIVISLPSDCFPAYVMQPLRRELAIQDEFVRRPTRQI